MALPTSCYYRHTSISFLLLAPINHRGHFFLSLRDIINVDKLTPKQQRFADEYIIDLNATQAAIRAGYSVKTAREQACVLLTNLNIQAAVQKALKKRAERTQITADRVLEELAKIAFSNIVDYVSFNGSTVTLGDSEQIEREKLAAIESVSEGKDGVKLKLHNKLTALNALSQHLGIDKPDTSSDEGEDDSNLIEALQTTVEEVWADEDADGETEE